MALVDKYIKHDMTHTETTSAKVLIIDDRLDLLEAIIDGLKKDYILLTASAADSGLKLARSMMPDLILLDVDLGDSNGVKLCETLRSDNVTAHIPILMFTGDADPGTITSAFDMGADDYIQKPCHPDIVFSRVRSKLKRWREFRANRNSDSTNMIFANIVICKDKKEVILEDRVIQFSPIEFEILLLFIENPEKVISRDLILDKVWKGTQVGKRTIDTHLTKLRKELDTFDYKFANVYGSGFILQRKI